MNEETERIGKDLTFEKVWATMQANSAEMKALSAEVWAAIRATDEQLKANAAQLKAGAEKTWKWLEANAEETRKHIAATEAQIRATEAQLKADKEEIKAANKRFGEFSNRFGEIVEHLVRPGLVKKFRELGFTFTEANRMEITDNKLGIYMELDAVLENGSTVLVIEIKSKPSIDDIKYLMKRMDDLRRYVDARGDKRIYLAGIAGVTFAESPKNYALKNGLYVIEPSGETFAVTAPAGDYCPREW